MLKRYDKNRLLIGIGKAQHLMLDLGRKLAVEQVIGEAGEIAAVVVELGQDFSQLCSPSTIRPRPYCPNRGSARGIARKALPPPRPCNPPDATTTAPLRRRHPFKREIPQKPSRKICYPASSMDKISYVKRDTASFCKGVLCPLRGGEWAIGRQDMGLAFD